jgi:hypothetical protein
LLSRIAAREEEIEKEMNTRWHKVFIACHGAVLARNELEWRPLLADPLATAALQEPVVKGSR